MKIIAGFVLFFAIGCGGGRTAGAKQILDFGAFTIEAPNNWKKIKDQGIDSYVGRIAIDSADTLHFDLGWYSNNLSEPDISLLNQSVNGSALVLDTSKTLAMEGDKVVVVNKKNNAYWDTIGGRKAKIVTLRQAGIGITGIYIDSLWRSGSDIDRFCLYGENLKPENQQQLLQALKTLRFIQRD